MNKKHFFTLSFIFITFIAFSQSWQSSIDKINNLTKLYDPYVRIFSYNEYTNKLKWVTKDGDITTEALMSDITYSAEPSGSNYYVTFKCKNGSKCIDCTYGGATDVSSITLTSHSAADLIIEEIDNIAKFKPLVKVELKPDVPNQAGSWQSSISRINELCVKYDPYIRKFSYTESTKTLKWIDNDGEITCSADLRDISVYVEAGTSDYSIKFKCNDDSKCIACNYTGPTSITAITINDKSAADEIVNEIKKIKSGNYSSPNKSFSWQTNIDRINELCVKYDPYIRKFSYNQNNNKLKWINKDGDITSEADLSLVTVNLKPSSYGTDYYVQFICKSSGSKCIDCTYGGASDLNSITVTDKSAGDEIVSLVQQIMDGGSSSPKTNVNYSSGWQSSITKINNLTNLYDPYIRTFTYNDSKNEITFITKDKDITITAKINDIYIYSEPSSGTSYYVTFECKDGTKCIKSSYSGETNLTSITITNQDAANQIVAEFQKNAPGTRKGKSGGRTPEERIKDIIK